MRSNALRTLSNSELRRALTQVVSNERSSTAAVVAHIAEYEARRLYLEDGYPSMYEYCVRKLHLSEQSALKRIRAARLTRRFPAILSALADGRLHLTAVFLLKRHLTSENAVELLAAVEHKTRSDIEQVLAQRFPQRDVPTRIRPIVQTPLAGLEAAPALQLSSGTPDEPASAQPASETPGKPVQLSPGTPEAPAQLSPGTPQEPFTRVAPLAPQRFVLQTTIDQETRDSLRRAQELLSHQIPSGDVSEILKRALRDLVVNLEKRKFAATDRPRQGRSSDNPRHISAQVKRTVWDRDQGQCTFVSDSGHRCGARRFLEFDHVDPVARGGQATLEGTRLLCRAHNQYEAEQVFGTGFMDRKRAEGRSAGACPS